MRNSLLSNVPNARVCLDGASWRTEGGYVAWEHGFVGVAYEGDFVIHRPARDVDEVACIADCLMYVSPCASRLKPAPLW